MTLLFFAIFTSTLFIIGFSATLDGPFNPKTAPLDPKLNPISVDLPESDPSFTKPSSEFQPEQISISLSYTFDSVWISWVTDEFQIGEDLVPLDPNSVQSLVQFSEFNAGNTEKYATGYSLVYNQEYLPGNGIKNNYTSGIIHHVQLTGLKPNTLYRYQCGDPSLSAMSREFYFRTMPKSTSQDYPHRIAVAGDLGLTYNTSTVLTHMLSNHPDLVLLIGGFSYADTYLTSSTKLNCSSCQGNLNGSSSECDSCYYSQESYQPRWDYWGRFMEPLMANVPTMMVAGDHEIELQNNDLAFIAYSSRFIFPSYESGSSSPLYYSFNAGGAHFIVLNANTPYDNSSDQYRWLENDLRNISRSETPWVVAAWSLPWYSSFKGHYREAECMRIHLEDLLYSYQVDIVFNSHVDAYERSNRVYNYKLDQCGPVYITTGAGGAGKLDIEHADDPGGNCSSPSQRYSDENCGFNFTSEPVNDESCPVKQPEYSAYRESSFGFGMLEVKNETHALWSWNPNQNLYNVAGDIVYIVRQPELCSVSH